MINASGCGTTVKDYGFMFRSEPEPWRSQAGKDLGNWRATSANFCRASAMRRRVTAPGLTVAYHSACSLQHGQQVTAEPKALLQRAGFTVVEPAEPHICCGSAGTYNMLQPEIAARLRERKLGNLRATDADLIAAGNIGCITQLAGGGIAGGAHDRVARLDGRWSDPAALVALRRGRLMPARSILRQHRMRRLLSSCCCAGRRSPERRRPPATNAAPRSTSCSAR